MINFFKNSIREFEHVVWPTSAETKRYFFVVLITLILFGTYLFIFNYVFGESIIGLRNLMNK